MKNLFKTFAILFLTITFIACSKDNDDFVFNVKSLEQTTWVGVEVVSDGGQVIRMKSVNIQFLTTTKGQYVINEDGTEAEVYDFKYSVKGKIMNIENGTLTGNWTLLKLDKDNIVLEMFSSYKVTLTLNKRY